MTDEELGAFVRKSVLDALERKDRNEIREEVERAYNRLTWVVWLLALLGGGVAGLVIGSLFPTFPQ